MSTLRRFENETERERSFESAVIHDLRENGLEKSRLYAEWRNRAEARVNSEEGNLDMLFAEASLLRNAGLQEEAKRHLEDAREAAFQMGADVRVKEIDALLTSY